VTPPLQPGVVGPLSGMGYRVPQPFAARENRLYPEFCIWVFCPDEYGMSLAPKHVHLKFLWIMQKFHVWYFLTCVYELNFVEANIPRDIFNTLDFDLNVELTKLHTIYHLQRLDITMISVWFMCSLNHKTDEKETWVCEPKSYKPNTIEPTN
jgi:hypothetical protein